MAEYQINTDPMHDEKQREWLMAQSEDSKRVKMHLRAAFLTSDAGRFAGRWLLNHLKLLSRLDGDEDKVLHNAAVDFMAAGAFNVTDFLEGTQNNGR